MSFLVEWAVDYAASGARDDRKKRVAARTMPMQELKRTKKVHFLVVCVFVCLLIRSFCFVIFAFSIWLKSSGDMN